MFVDVSRRIGPAFPVASVAAQCIDDVYRSGDDSGMDESFENTTNERRTTTNKTTTTATNDSESFRGNNIRIVYSSVHSIQ